MTPITSSLFEQRPWKIAFFWVRSGLQLVESLLPLPAPDAGPPCGSTAVDVRLGSPGQPCHQPHAWGEGPAGPGGPAPEGRHRLHQLPALPQPWPWPADLRTTGPVLVVGSWTPGPGLDRWNAHSRTNKVVKCESCSGACAQARAWAHKWAHAYQACAWAKKIQFVRR